jgi:hypothetical protein
MYRKKKKDYSLKIGRTGIPVGFLRYAPAFIPAILILIGCSKNRFYDHSVGDPLKAEIVSVLPANLAGGVFVDPEVSVTYKDEVDIQTISSTVISLKKGNSEISGDLSVNGNTVSFIPDADLDNESEYTATVITASHNPADFESSHVYEWKFKTGKNHRIDSLSIVGVLPASAATQVPVNSRLITTFNHELTASMMKSVFISLRKGSTNVNGVVTFTGSTATFQPSASLLTGTVYNASVTIGSGNNSGNNLKYKSWSYTTEGTGADVTPPTVVSANPANSSTNASITTKLSVTFSEAMKLSTISASSFILKQGTISVAGSVTYSGTTATFSPSANLSASTVYTASITTAVTDVAGNALSTAYNWTFTTAAMADVTPPSISSVSPLSGASSVAIGSMVTATFNEPVDASTLTASTFTLKQGTVSVAGVISISGSTVTFTPASALTGNTVYTVTITNGVKDLSGNAMSANYTWNFTTVAAVTGKSFANDVAPILNLCNTCHTHKWTTSPTASTFYANLVSAGYVNPTAPTSGKIYTKLTGGHPPGSTVSASQVTAVLTWITEGSKNN